MEERGDFFGDQHTSNFFREDTRRNSGVRNFLVERTCGYLLKRKDMHKRIFEIERTCGGTFLERTCGILEESKGLQKEIKLPL